jgi:hypothetical protein
MEANMTYLKSGITIRTIVVLLAVAASFLVWQAVVADRVEESPPSYGSTINLPEVDLRVLGDEVTLTVPVDQAELQALMDSLYPESDYAAPSSIGLSFDYGQVSDIPGADVFGLGPTNRMFAFAIARDGGAGPEIVSLGAWRNDPVTNAAYLTHLGISSKPAAIKVNIEHDNDILRFKFDVRDENLRIKLRAEGPAVMVGRTFSNPIPISFRTTDVRANLAQQYDFAPCDEGSVHLSGDLKTSAGTLNLPGKVASCQIRRWREIHVDILD